MNRDCDYGHSSKEAYRLDLGFNSGINLCEKHWKKEMDWRKDRNKNLNSSAQFEILPFPKKEKK